MGGDCDDYYRCLNSLYLVMIILITILSIYVFIGLAYLVRNKLSLNICSICAGVSLTWAWMLLGIILKIIPNTFTLPMVVLMGFSILGIANKLKNKQYKFWQSPKTYKFNRIEKSKDRLKDCC